MKFAMDNAIAAFTRTVGADLTFFRRRPDRSFRVRLASELEGTIERPHDLIAWPPPLMPPAWRVAVATHLQGERILYARCPVDPAFAADVDAFDEHLAQVTFEGMWAYRAFRIGSARILKAAEVGEC